MFIFDWLFDRDELQGWEQVAFVFSNIGMGACMFTISLVLAVVGFKRRKDLSTPYAVLAFIIFCFLIGIRGLTRIWLYGSGLYRVITLLDVVTALSALHCIYYIPTVWKLGLKIPTPEKLKSVENEKEVLAQKAEVLTQVAEEKEAISNQLERDVCKKDAIIQRMTDSIAPLGAVINKINEKIEEAKIPNGT